MDPARSYESMTSLLWLLSKDETKSYREREREREPFCFDVGTRFCIHEKHRNWTNAFSSFIFDFVAFSSLCHPEPIKITCSPKATANQHSMAEVSSTFATRWEKHRSLWIANELDSATLGVFGLTVGQAGEKAGKWHFFPESLLIFEWFCHFLPGRVK